MQSNYIYYTMVCVFVFVCMCLCFVFGRTKSRMVASVQSNMAHSMDKGRLHTRLDDCQEKAIQKCGGASQGAD